MSKFQDFDFENFQRTKFTLKLHLIKIIKKKHLPGSLSQKVSKT